MIDFITGFLAGEASFTVQANTSANRIYPVLSVIVHEKDVETLYAIQEFFDAGAVYDSPDNCKMWRVNNQKDLQAVVEELDQCESWQVTEKYDQYITWRRLVELYTEEYHTSTETAIEMAELARDELNVGLGKSESSWNDFIDSLR